MGMRAKTALLMPLVPLLAGMQPLNEKEMGSVAGQDGVAFEWDMRINALEDGSPDPQLSNVERRLAISLAERDGEWIVLKDMSGRINFPTFHLDAFEAPLSPSPYADTGRFEAIDGSVTTPYGSPHLLLTFPEDIEFWDVRIGGVAVEFDDPGGDPGFLQDPLDENSFLSLGLNNAVPGEPGTLAAEGRVTVFGF